ncbi:MAG TPA: 16S rRNA (guanine(966)-N(2))-methyltransferase RsmD [Anaerolineae bacterium]|nr:16S rRNA (guanine(966)-N(2))-methyltransferase RsmD [Anaerolineae bacterium]HQH39923.1 16S rRNA (guanine(966)-N(2))-methyltransferase RsmD [Anaerolineae bacterium]
MRVIAGKAKGRKLRAVPGPGTRPMTDRAKSALFSILSEDVAEAHFLDLFAGTGQVGIEALSRGAAHAVFVEKDATALRVIHNNLALTGLAAWAEVVRDDVFHYLAAFPRPFDYIYIAPPQYRGLWGQTLRVLDAFPAWLKEDGWAIVQINPVEYEPLVLDHLTLFDQRKYGSVMLCFYIFHQQ